jgi:hypothetical protein
MTETNHLILEAHNPLELTREELDSLAAELQLILISNDIINIQVVVFEEPTEGVATDFWETLYLFLPDTEIIKSVVWTAILASAWKFMAARFSRPHESKRPRALEVLDPSGKSVDKSVLETRDSEIQHVDSETERTPPDL